MARPSGVLQVQREAALVAVQVLEIEAVPVVGGDVDGARLLDLQRPRAPVGQLPHAGRAGARMRQVEHLDPPQRAVGGAACSPSRVARTFFAGDDFRFVHKALQVLSIVTRELSRSPRG